MGNFNGQVDDSMTISDQLNLIRILAAFKLAGGPTPIQKKLFSASQL
jgi:hypothetical protein